MLSRNLIVPETRNCNSEKVGTLALANVNKTNRRASTTFALQFRLEQRMASTVDCQKTFAHPCYQDICFLCGLGAHNNIRLLKHLIMLEFDEATKFKSIESYIKANNRFLRKSKKTEISGRREITSII